MLLTKKTKIMPIHIGYTAFTLSEVLVTLTIIGIIAAITLPIIINEYYSKSFEKQWKKQYANISNAYNLTKNKNIDVCAPNPNAFYYCPINNEFITDLLTEFNVTATKTITYIYVKSYSGLSSLNGNSFHITEMYGGTKAYLLDGTVLYIGQAWPAWNILVDVNGDKAPNQMGKDILGAEVRQEWLKPIGAPSTTGANISSYGASSCSENSTTTAGRFVYISGAGCSYKYLYNN